MVKVVASTSTSNCPKSEGCYSVKVLGSAQSVNLYFYSCTSHSLITYIFLLYKAPSLLIIQDLYGSLYINFNNIIAEELQSRQPQK
jgi:hypothetical protein